MANSIYFDSYDCDLNERGFSAEELDTVRRLLSEGKRVWMAPVVIEETEQLETLCVTRSRCRTWRTGPEKRLVYLTPGRQMLLQLPLQKKPLRSSGFPCLLP